MSMEWKKLRKKHDPDDMYGRVASFPDQMEDAWRIGTEFAAHLPTPSFSRIVVCGMGGSAIGGDMAAAFLGDRLRVPLISCRDYVAPAYLRDDSLVIVSSYSGKTGETLAAFETLRGGTSTFLAITSGGRVAELGDEAGFPVCRIPGGMPPRSALGYSLLPMLLAIRACGGGVFEDSEYEEALAAVRQRCEDCAFDAGDNPAVELAEKISGRLPFVYAGPGLLAAAARRWAGQINENAKTLSHFALYPELNHNEIVGWHFPEELRKRVAVVSLEDREDHDKTRRQTDVGLGIVEPLADSVTRVGSGDGGRLARLLSIVSLGDFVSVYLALLGGVDPTPVEKIDYLKSQL